MYSYWSARTTLISVDLDVRTMRNEDICLTHGCVPLSIPFSIQHKSAAVNGNEMFSINFLPAIPFGEYQSLLISISLLPFFTFGLLAAIYKCSHHLASGACACFHVNHCAPFNSFQSMKWRVEMKSSHSKTINLWKWAYWINHTVAKWVYQ